MPHHSLVNIAVLFASLFGITHAANKCKHHAQPVNIPNGDFETGYLAPWDQYPSPAGIKNASIYSPGYKGKYAVQIPLPAYDFNKKPDEYNYTTTEIIQQVYDTLCPGYYYRVSLAYNWLVYDGPEDPPLCNFLYDVGDLGYFSMEASRTPGWRTHSFVATPEFNQTNFNIQADLDCLPVNTTNTTPKVTLLLDNLFVKRLRHYTPPDSMKK